jgi:hypothetical protein
MLMLAFAAMRQVLRLCHIARRIVQACDLNRSSTSPKGAQDKPERHLPQPAVTRKPNIEAIQAPSRRSRNEREAVGRWLSRC